MIIARLMGGMGNQMFQYAIARNLSIKHKVPMKMDLSFLQNRNQPSGFIYRDYDLDIFNVLEDFELNNVIKEIMVPEPHYHYSEELTKLVGQELENGHKIILNGFWQSYKYFSENESSIRKDFTFKSRISDGSPEHEILMKIKNNRSVAINIRRTDYLNTNYHGVIGKDYVDAAMSLIEEDNQEQHYFIFSDDIEWCKQNLKYDNSTIVGHDYKGEKFGTYLQLMSECEKFIIPNSTFAWWAAWLSECSNKRVIAPKKWVTDTTVNTNDLIPKNWQRI